MNNIVADALADGLKPVDTIPARDLIQMSIDAKVGRLEKWQERVALAAERTADAAERQADAFEMIAALLASVTGVGKAYCYPAMSDGEITRQAVNYLRTGSGSKAFACDQSNAESDDDEA